MEKDLLTHFENGVKALEDIQSLANQDVSPVINRAFFHFGKGYEALQNDSLTLNGSKSLKKLIESSFRTVIHKSILGVEQVRQLNVVVDKDLGISTWNKVFDIVDELGILPSLLPFHGKLDMQLTINDLQLRGKVLNAGIEVQKEKCYWLTRSLLKKKILATFKVEEHNQITLKIDFAHRMDEMYVLNGDSRRNIWLGFTPILLANEISPEKFTSMDNHYCVEITDNLNTVCHLRPPVETLLNSSKMIIHFPFLFRPVSLIIPRKGQIMSVGPERKGSTGSDVTFKANRIPPELQDQEYISSINYIDIFDLLA